MFKILSRGKILMLIIFKRFHFDPRWIFSNNFFSILFSIYQTKIRCHSFFWNSFVIKIFHKTWSYLENMFLQVQGVIISFLQWNATKCDNVLKLRHSAVEWRCSFPQSFFCCQKGTQNVMTTPQKQKVELFNIKVFKLKFVDSVW